jgi:hypothetical protein
MDTSEHYMTDFSISSITVRAIYATGIKIADYDVDTTDVLTASYSHQFSTSTRYYFKLDNAIPLTNGGNNLASVELNILGFYDP